MINSKAKKRRLSSVLGIHTVLVSLITVCMLWSNSVFSLGVGAASTDSFIGDKLSVYIPLFNVNSPNDISVIIQPSQNGNLYGNNPLSAKLENKQSQLGIRVTSEKITAEPFVSFVVDVIDGGSVTSKEFSVLLDLAPVGTISPSRRINNSGTTQAQNYDNSNERTAYINSNRSVSSRTGSVMGPYDWAVAGQVPAEFGPVLDGQSLWRVARRINKSLDVSIDQMMWSLYQNNRDKFATNSITSLKAGSYLRIPTAQQASSISELAAVRNIKQNISTGGTSAPASNNNSTATTQNSEKSNISEASISTKSAENEQASFDLTGLNLSEKFNDKISGIDSKAQQIIASLAESVGNLTQELIKKDRKIAFLEEKVAALEAYAKVSAEDLNIRAPESGLIELEGQIIDQTASDEKEVANLSATETEIPINNTEEDAVPPVAITKQIDQPAIETRSAVESAWWSSIKWWHILLAILGLFLLFAILLRNWILDLFRSLNLFKKENEIEFENTEFEPVQPEVEKRVVEEIDPDLTVENKKKLNGLSHKAILDTINNMPEIDIDDALSPQTVIDLEGDYAYTEVYSDLEFIDEEGPGEAGLPFVERFDKAIKSGDFGFALQLLNMSRGNEIDDEEYHFQRLRMYEQMHDEDAFYDYFCEIENYIPRFKPEIQKQISHLVMEMAQQ